VAVSAAVATDVSLLGVSAIALLPSLLVGVSVATLNVVTVVDVIPLSPLVMPTASLVDVVVVVVIVVVSDGCADDVDCGCDVTSGVCRSLVNVVVVASVRTSVVEPAVDADFALAFARKLEPDTALSARKP
jgi:hypothetical protein